jgi:hypothetical protein
LGADDSSFFTAGARADTGSSARRHGEGGNGVKTVKA